jgi:two-component system, cell cycle response regulator
MGLRARVIIFVVGIVLVSHIAWGLVTIREQAGLHRQRSVDHGLEVLRALAGPCSVPLARREIEDLDAMLARFSEERDWQDLDLLYVAVLDAEGRVVAHTDPRLFATRYDDDFTRRAVVSPVALAEEVSADGHRRLRLSMPIRSGLRWGTATAELSLERVERWTRAMQLRELNSSLVTALALGGLLYVLLAALLLRPLDQLTSALRGVAAGDLETRLPGPVRNDELGLIAGLFNDMAARVQAATGRLEETVQTRTAELEEVNTELRRLARTDGLTGLDNHRTLRQRLEEEVARAGRYGQPLALVMIDVDHFKTYNDSHGHPAGDLVLQQIASLLRVRLRQADVVARYGGEEFAAVLPATTQTAAVLVAEELVAAVRAAPFPGQEVQPGGRVTISAGVAGWRSGDETAGSLLARADAALYRAKAAGRDQVRTPEVAR